MYEIVEASDRIFIKKEKGKLEPEESQSILRMLRQMGITVSTEVLRDFALTEEETMLEIPKRDIVVYVSPDELDATVRISQNSQPTYEDIVNAAAEYGVVFGLLEREIISNLSQGRKEFKIAEGKFPKDGENGRLILRVELPKKRVRADAEKGKVDLYELDIFRFVKAGQVIAEVVPPTPGEDGMTVTGKVLKAKDGEKAVYSLGDNVGIEGNQIKALTDGVLKFEENRFSVDPVLLIPGDVDLTTGNINSEVDVLIKGWVRSGFKVVSKKDITIEGGVEKDVVLEADGNISVKGGVFGGPKSYIYCKKNLYAKFLQDIKVVVEGDIYVNEYIMNSEIQCYGSLFLSGQKGKMMNSEVSLKYAAYVKELVGGKRKLRIAGFSRKELISLVKKLNDERERLKKIMVDLSVEIKQSITRLAEIKASGGDIVPEMRRQKELSDNYKKLLATYAKLESRIDEIKELLTHVKGEGALYVISKAEDLKVVLKSVPLELPQMGSGVIYIDENDEVRKE